MQWLNNDDDLFESFFFFFKAKSVGQYKLKAMLKLEFTFTEGP